MNIFNHKNKDKKPFQPIDNIPQIVYGPPEYFKNKDKESVSKEVSKPEKSKKDDEV